jgi:hypothetical protein
VGIAALFRRERVRSTLWWAGPIAVVGLLAAGLLTGLDLGLRPQVSVPQRLVITVPAAASTAAIRPQPPRIVRPDHAVVTEDSDRDGPDGRR